MMLIADSGSTKTDWRFIDEQNKIHQLKSSGLNPFFLNENQITEIILNELEPDERLRNVDELFFYGAGCVGQPQRELVVQGLSKVFFNAKIAVEHDLLGACRSLCGREAGIVGILGTGSNSCFFENGIITQQIPSLGYILGDEGSGAYIGKKLLQAFFYKELPNAIADRLKVRFQLTKESVLDTVYRKPLPNRFLASFAPFVFQNRTEESICKIVFDSFSDFFIHHVCKYNVAKPVSLHCTGSIAYYFGDVLRKVAEANDVQLVKITENPIAGLTLYHLNE